MKVQVSTTDDAEVTGAVSVGFYRLYSPYLHKMCQLAKENEVIGVNSVVN